MKVMHGGVYFLYDGDELVYIGQTDNLMRRIGEHIKEGVKRFDSFELYETPDRIRLEARLIGLLKPKYNMTEGAPSGGAVNTIGHEMFPSKDIAATIAAIEDESPWVDFRTIKRNATERTHIDYRWQSPYYLARDGKINAVNIGGVWKVPLADAEQAINAVIEDEEAREQERHERWMAEHGQPSLA